MPGKLSKGMVPKILNKRDIGPHKVSYYLEQRDTEHDMKIAQALHVYKEVEMYSLKSAGFSNKVMGSG